MRGQSSQQLTFGEGFINPSQNLRELQALGIRHLGLPKIGRLTPRERRKEKSRWFKKLQRFRCGIEAAISMLKRCFSLDRILSPGSVEKNVIGPLNEESLLNL